MGASVALAGEPTTKTPAIVPAAVHLGHPVDFEKDVYPILESNCLACHNAGVAESKLNIETADAIRKGGKRGPAVLSKNPEGSPLFLFASRGKEPAMPPLPNKVEAAALTPTQLGIIKQWILEGARGGAGGGGDAIQFQPIPPGEKSILAVALSPNGGRFVVAGRANQVVVYDVPAGREVDHLIDPLLSGIQLEGRPMYPGGAADRDVIHALAFSPDGTLLAAGGYRVVKLWQRPHNIEKHKVTLADRPTALAVSPDGSLVAVALADRSVTVRRADGAEVRKLAGPADVVSALQFGPDGKTLYAASLDRTWRAWNVADGAPRGVVTAESPLQALAISGDGMQVIVGGADGAIRIWTSDFASKPSTPTSKSPQPKKPLREWKANDRPITALAVVLPTGDRLVSGGADGSVRVWQIATARQLAKFDQGGPVTAVAVRPDGQVLASAGTNRVARLWKIAGGGPIAEIKGSLTAQRRVTAAHRRANRRWAARHSRRRANHRGHAGSQRASRGAQEGGRGTNRRRQSARGFRAEGKGSPGGRRRCEEALAGQAEGRRPQIQVRSSRESLGGTRDAQGQRQQGGRVGRAGARVGQEDSGCG